MGSLFHDLLHIFSPKLCYSCSKEVIDENEFICFSCSNKLYFTDYYLIQDNPVFQKFEGRFNIEGAFSAFHFSKSSVIQELLHHLKYNNKPEIGFMLGKMFKIHLISVGFDFKYDFIIPVPIHERKLLIRGYNQAEMWANGLAHDSSVVLKNVIIKSKETESQTKKSRNDRFSNVSDSFTITDQNILSGKNILLVDDVITTGATIDSILLLLNTIPNIKISICSIALAQ
jgi:ComF family protein